MRVLYFAWLREKVGCAAEEVAPPATIATVQELIDWLKGLDAGHAAAFAQQRLVRCAIDQEFASPGTSLAGVREVAFFPPVTGG